jgi:endonuclease/exonuclease/phosphatase family metal-dependent hydrolase
MPSDANAGSARLRVATWNIHGGVGRDRRRDVERIVAVLREIGADVVGLQEVASLELHGEFLRELKRGTQCEVVCGPTLSRRGSEFGNALLARHPVRNVTHLDLALPKCEPRGAIDAILEVEHAPFRVVVTHLGLRPSERREQVKRILAVMEREGSLPTVLMGDVNEWYLWGRPLRWLHAHFGSPRALSTFPASAPCFALDRIWVQPARWLTHVRVHRSALARVASDHLPLVADITVQRGAAAYRRMQNTGAHAA